MNIRKEIEELVFNKYGLKVNDPLSILHQAVKLWEEDVEFWGSDTEEQQLKELGDIIFVFESLILLMDFRDFEFNYSTDNIHLDNGIKQLNQLNKSGLVFFEQYISNLIAYVYFEDIGDLDTLEEKERCLEIYNQLLQQTILKNQGRSGKIINGCYVKSEDI